MQYTKALEETKYPGTGRWNLSAAARLLETITVDPVMIHWFCWKFDSQCFSSGPRPSVTYLEDVCALQHPASLQAEDYIPEATSRSAFLAGVKA